MLTVIYYDTFFYNNSDNFFLNIQNSQNRIMDNLEENLTVTESSVLSSSNDVLINHRDVAVTLDQPIDLASSHTTALSANEATTNITATLQTSTFSAGTESPDKNATKSNKTPLDVPSTSAAAAAASANDSASALNKDTSGTGI